MTIENYLELTRPIIAECSNSSFKNYFNSMTEHDDLRLKKLIYTEIYSSTFQSEIVNLRQSRYFINDMSFFHFFWVSLFLSQRKEREIAQIIFDGFYLNTVCFKSLKYGDELVSNFFYYCCNFKRYDLLESYREEFNLYPHLKTIEIFYFNNLMYHEIGHIYSEVDRKKYIDDMVDYLIDDFLILITEEKNHNIDKKQVNKFLEIKITLAQTKKELIIKYAQSVSFKNEIYADFNALFFMLIGLKNHNFFGNKEETIALIKIFFLLQTDFINHLEIIDTALNDLTSTDLVRDGFPYSPENLIRTSIKNEGIPLLCNLLEIDLDFELTNQYINQYSFLLENLETMFFNAHSLRFPKNKKFESKLTELYQLKPLGMINEDLKKNFQDMSNKVNKFWQEMQFSMI